MPTCTHHHRLQDHRPAKCNYLSTPLSNSKWPYLYCTAPHIQSIADKRPKWRERSEVRTSSTINPGLPGIITKKKRKNPNFTNNYTALEIKKINSTHTHIPWHMMLKNTNRTKHPGRIPIQKWRVFSYLLDVILFHGSDSGILVTDGCGGGDDGVLSVFCTFRTCEHLYLFYSFEKPNQRNSRSNMLCIR